MNAPFSLPADDAVIDPHLVFLQRASALCTLVEAGEMTPADAFAELAVDLHCRCSRETVRQWEKTHPHAAAQKAAPQPCAAASTVQALMHSLRSGAAALDRADVRQRLSQLNGSQLKAVCAGVRKFLPDIATPWSEADSKSIAGLWRQLHVFR